MSGCMHVLPWESINVLPASSEGGKRRSGSARPSGNGACCGSLNLKGTMQVSPRVTTSVCPLLNAKGCACLRNCIFGQRFWLGGLLATGRSASTTLTLCCMAEEYNSPSSLVTHTRITPVRVSRHARIHFVCSGSPSSTNETPSRTVFAWPTILRKPHTVSPG